MRLLILTILFSAFLSLNGVKASKPIKGPLTTILTYKGSADLIQRVESQGPLEISYVSFGKEKVHALWDVDSRTIFINSAIKPSDSSIMNSIIFELHNALSTPELENLFSKAENGLLTKEQFVEGVERMEHRNAIAAQKLIDNGIAQGRLPESCRLYYYDDFDDYYIVQQVFGHSQWIAAKYDEFSPIRHVPYKGTISSLPLHSQQEKFILLDYVSLKNDLIDHSIEQRLAWVETQYAKAGPKEAAILNFVFEKDLDSHPLYFSKAFEI